MNLLYFSLHKIKESVITKLKGKNSVSQRLHLTQNFLNMEFAPKSEI